MKKIYRNIGKLFRDSEFSDAVFNPLLDDLILQSEQIQVEAGIGFQLILQENVRNKNFSFSRNKS